MNLAFRLRQPVWIVPLAIAGFVGVFGWWGNGRLRQTIEEELKSDLTAALDANVTALEIWTKTSDFYGASRRAHALRTGTVRGPKAWVHGSHACAKAKGDSP
jgi:hypothetical protein